MFGVGVSCRNLYSFVVYLNGTLVDQLPRSGKRELIFLLLFTCNYVVSVWRGFLFLCVLGMGYVILLWHYLSLPYNYFAKCLHAGLLSNFVLVNRYDRLSCRGNESYVGPPLYLPDKQHTSLVMRNPVFGVSDQVRHKPGCRPTEDS